MADIDRTDLKILRALADDGRLSWRDLAQKIGLSLTPTLRRVRRLEEERYIQGYFAQLDEERLSGAMSVFVSVTLEKQTGDYLARFEESIVQAPQVMSGLPGLPHHHPDADSRGGRDQVGVRLEVGAQALSAAALRGRTTDLPAAPRRFRRMG
jgi:hypothetical protein